MGLNITDQVIYIDSKPFAITTNLRDSLYQVRLEDIPRALWVDSICINQDNLQEKSKQVAAMGEIYRSSNCTLICLGSDQKDKENAQNAAALIQDINESMDQILRDPAFNGDWNTFPWPQVDDPLLADNRWRSFGQLAHRPWFYRGWVVQEAALASNAVVLWAGAKIPWISLLRADYWGRWRAQARISHPEELNISKLHQQAFEIGRHREAIMFHPEFVKSQINALPILGILDYARVLKLSDARDRIYAFMAMPTAEEPMALRPDYEKPYWDIYKNFAVQYLETTSNLDILTYIEHDEASFAQGPSWVPWWDRGEGLQSITNTSFSKMGPAHFAIVQNGSCLRVRATIIAPIEYISERIKPAEEEPDSFAQLVALWKEIASRSLQSPGPYQSRVALAFAETLACGRYNDSLERWNESQNTFTRLLQQDQPQRRTHAEDDQCQRITNFILLWSNYRRFAILQRGYFGVGPSITRQGDVCAIISGTCLPFFLRKIPGRKNHYKVLGVAFVLSKELESDSETPVRLGRAEKAKDWREWNLPEEDIILC